jgi:hypothetical protein
MCMPCAECSYNHQFCVHGVKVQGRTHGVHRGWSCATARVFLT